MIFPTFVSGIPCQCEVTHATRYVPMQVYGPGMADANPPEEAEFEFNLLDRKGYKANWLESKLTDKDRERLYEEFAILCEAEEYEDAY